MRAQTPLRSRIPSASRKRKLSTPENLVKGHSAFFQLGAAIPCYCDNADRQRSFASPETHRTIRQTVSHCAGPTRSPHCADRLTQHQPCSLCTTPQLPKADSLTQRRPYPLPTLRTDSRSTSPTRSPPCRNCRRQTVSREPEYRPSTDALSTPSHSLPRPLLATCKSHDRYYLILRRHRCFSLCPQPHAHRTASAHPPDHPPTPS